MRIWDGEYFGLSLRKTRRHEDTTVDTTTALGAGQADMRWKTPTDWLGPKLLSLLAVSAPPPWKI